MTMTLERPEMGAVNGNGHVDQAIDISSIRKGLAQDRWNRVMRGFEVVELETAFNESCADRNFMERYRELETGHTVAEQKMPWLYR